MTPARQVFEEHHRRCQRCFYGTTKSAASTKAGAYQFDGCPRGKKLRRSYQRAEQRAKAAS